MKPEVNKGKNNIEGRWFCNTLEEYCRQSTLHGLKYIGEPSLPKAERIFWLIIVLSALYACYKTIWIVYDSDALQEFGVSFNSVSTPIWDVPFPTVLVCPLYTVKKSYFDLKINKNNTKFMHYSKLICPFPEDFEVFDGEIEEDFFHFMKEASIPCKRLIKHCSWKGQRVDCCSMFKPTMTFNGQCYVFNNVPGEIMYNDYIEPEDYVTTYDDRALYWDVDKGYPSREGKQADLVFPLWSQLAGIGSGLTMDLIDVHQERQEMCSGGHSGFEIKIYSPSDDPEVISGIRIANNVHTYIKMKPTLIMSELGFSSIPQEKRGCLFQNEYNLTLYKKYTQTSCYLECYLEHMMDKCNCVPAHSKKIKEKWDCSYCTDAVLSTCGIKVLEDILQLQINGDHLIDGCYCMAPCNTLYYNFERSFEHIVEENSAPPWTDSNEQSPKTSKARVSIYFGFQQFFAQTRRITSSYSSVLGYCGGLLGLLLGFSYMSVFEIFYFTIFRPLNKLLTHIVSLCYCIIFKRKY